MSADDIALIAVSVAFGIFLIIVGVSIVISTIGINRTIKEIREKLSEEEEDNG